MKSPVMASFFSAPCPTASIPAASFSWEHRLKTSLLRLATAAAAVVGLSALASQGAVGSTPGLADGTYLYGESAIADTVGAVYFVFEAKNGQLTGAIYQPASSFDCVRGTVGGGAIDLVITDAYDQTETPYSVALVTDTAVASAGGGAIAKLEGMHAIAPLSGLDHHLLTACASR